VKVKLSLCLTKHHAMKKFSRDEWRYTSTHSEPRHYIEVSEFRPQPLYPRERAVGTRTLGGPQNLSGHGGEEKISQLLPGLEHPKI